MAGSPFRERRISPEETRRIVARAVALGAHEPTAKIDAPALTEAELAQRLGELGLAEEAIRRALASPDVEVPLLPSRGALRVVHEEDFEGTIAVEQHEALAEAMSSAMGSRGRVEVVGRKLTWTPGGMLQEPALTVHSKEGRTHLKVEEMLANRGQRILAALTAAFFAALFAAPPGIGIAAAIGASAGTGKVVSVAFVCAFVLAWALVAVVAVNKLLALRLRRRTRALGEAMANVAVAARALSAPTPGASEERVRVAAPEATDVEAEAAAEVEATEAEATAADRRAITER